MVAFFQVSLNIALDVILESMKLEVHPFLDGTEPEFIESIACLVIHLRVQSPPSERS
jgi:hypothetical protein